MMALQSSEKMPVKKARILWGREAFLDFLFFRADFLAPNFILGPGLLALFRGGPLLVLLEAGAERVDFLAVFRGDLRVVFFAGMVRLLHSFWGI